MGTTGTTAGGTVAPEKILRELADLWVTLGKSGEAGEGTSALRAASMTLVVMAEESDDASALGETIAALMPEHPGRTIVVRLRGAGERTLAEHVSAQCWMPFGQHRQVCCEQVEIAVSDAALADLPSVVLPLAEADLPLILWCRSPRLVELPEFGPIAQMAHKIIVDSCAAPDGKAALRWIADASKHGLLLGDLSWTRLTRWREMLSQIFENRQNLSRLPTFTDVTVTVSGETPVAAWYLGAWVMQGLEQLGVHAQFHLEHEEGTAGNIRRVEMAGPDSQVELARWRDRMVTTVNGLAHCFNLPKITDYLLMREELRIVGRDPVFDRTLGAALLLAGASS